MVPATRPWETTRAALPKSSPFTVPVNSRVPPVVFCTRVIRKTSVVSSKAGTEISTGVAGALRKAADLVQHGRVEEDRALANERGHVRGGAQVSLRGRERPGEERGTRLAECRGADREEKAGEGQQCAERALHSASLARSSGGLNTAFSACRPPLGKGNIRQFRIPAKRE